MEVIIGLFLIIGGIWLVGIIADSFQTHSSSNAVQPPPTSLQIKVEGKTEPKQKIPYWSIQLFGPLGVTRSANVSVQVSIFDVTDGKPYPVISALEQFQESGTRTFSSVARIGACSPGDGFIKWVQIGFAPTELLMFPFPGTRKIRFEARIIDSNSPPIIHCGHIISKCGLYRVVSTTITKYVDRGYLAKNEEELGICAASIRLGFCVAFSDGEFDTSEGKLIKAWAQTFITEIPEGPSRQEAQEYINTAIKMALEDGQKGRLSTRPQIDTLNALAGDPEKYAALELCLDVMAADGIADSQELKALDEICSGLSLDKEHFRQLREKRLIKIDHDEVGHENVWEVLGIPENLPEKEKLSKLKDLYRVWNSRAESLPNPVEREKAQNMLNTIAEARKSLRG